MESNIPKDNIGYQLLKLVLGKGYSGILSALQTHSEIFLIKLGPQEECTQSISAE